MSLRSLFHAAGRIAIECLYPLVVVLATIVGSYTPEDVTELQAVPLMLQGGSDWGGSLIFAWRTSSVIGLSVVYTVRLCAGLPLGRTFLSTLVQALPLVGGGAIFLALVGSFNLFEERGEFFRCETGMTMLVLGLIFLLNIVFLVSVASKVSSRRELILIGPCFLTLSVITIADGTTFKAGQVLQAGEIPPIEVRGSRHWFVTYPLRSCYTDAD